jgi:hypothetical protein
MAKEVLNTTLWNSDDFETIVSEVINYVCSSDTYYARHWRSFKLEEVSLNIKPSSTSGCRASYQKGDLTFYISSPWSFDSTSPLAAILLADGETWIASKQAARSVTKAILTMTVGYYNAERAKADEKFNELSLRFKPRRIKGLDKLTQRKKLLLTRLSKSSSRFEYEQKRADFYQQKANHYREVKEKTQKTMNEVNEKIDKMLLKMKETP